MEVYITCFPVPLIVCHDDYTKCEMNDKCRNTRKSEIGRKMPGSFSSCPSADTRPRHASQSAAFEATRIRHAQPFSPRLLPAPLDQFRLAPTNV